MIESFSKVQKSKKLGSFVFSLGFTFSGYIGRDTNIFKSGEFRKKLMELKNKSYIAVAE